MDIITISPQLYMTNTFKDKVKYAPRKRKKVSNPYGLCRCGECTIGRRNGTNIGMVMKAKHKFRTAWKTGKKILKGVYTDV